MTLSLFLLFGIPAVLLLFAVGAVAPAARRAPGGDPVAARSRRAGR